MTRRNQKNTVSTASSGESSSSGLSARVDNIEEALKLGIEDLKNQILNNGNTPEALSSIGEKLDDFKNSALQSLQVIRDELRKLGEKNKVVESTMEELRQEYLLNSLVIFGIEEKNDEDPIETVCQVLNSRLWKHSNRTDLSKVNINYCQRIGRKDTGHKKPRPLSVEFTNRWMRDVIFGLKRHLKGTSVVVSERLIKSRLELYNQAREKLGIKSCWTRRGQVYVSVSGTKRKIVSKSDLDGIIIGDISEN